MAVVCVYFIFQTHTSVVIYIELHTPEKRQGSGAYGPHASWQKTEKYIYSLINKLLGQKMDEQFQVLVNENLFSAPTCKLCYPNAC